MLATENKMMDDRKGSSRYLIGTNWRKLSFGYIIKLPSKYVHNT